MTTISPSTAMRRSAMRDVVALAVPVAAVQLGMMLMGVVDTLMVGRVSETALAAAALGNLYFYTVAMFGLGTLMALDPLVSQAVGAGDEEGVTLGLQRGLVLSLPLTLVGVLALLAAAPVLSVLRQPPEVVRVAASFSAASAPGLLGFLLFGVLRQTLQAKSRVREIVWTIVIANLANVALNFALVPRHGAVGSAWASTLSRSAMALALAVLAWPRLRANLRPARRNAIDPRALGTMLGIGVPIGLQFVLEVGAFNVIAVLMGWLGTTALAGHEVALTIASTTFMVPLGIGQAAAVLVGNAVGAREPPRAREAAVASLVCGVGFMAACGLVLLAIPGALARLFTTEVGAAAVAASLIPLAGIFQVFDGTQVVSAGVLRGMGDTRAPMVINVLGFWLVGVPVSLWLGFRTDAGPRGLWWGLVAGLGVVAAVLVVRVRMRLGE